LAARLDMALLTGDAKPSETPTIVRTVPTHARLGNDVGRIRRVRTRTAVTVQILFDLGQTLPIPVETSV
jgi:hypothetical protein